MEKWLGPARLVGRSLLVTRRWPLPKEPELDQVSPPVELAWSRPRSIAMQAALPSLQVRHSEMGGRESWTVRATWEDGTFEEIPGFQSELEANDWITNKFRIWLEEVRKARGVEEDPI
jgi:hypothetical protein